MTSKRGNSPRAKSFPRTHVAKAAIVSSLKRYLFFGGKGGVGKTTTAAATALFLLNNSTNEESTLLFSTDPAHSLSDSLGINIGNRLVEVGRTRRAKLFAYEMDATTALERFRDSHGPVLAEIAERGTFLDENDINELLNLSLPGLDEVMSLFELSELDRSGSYSRIIVDTAPTGHTSRLLRLPDTFQRISHALDTLAEKHRYIVTQFARRVRRLDDVDIFLQELNERIDRVRKMLFDEEQSSFTLVAIPEAMSICETERYFKLLKQEGVHVGQLILNRVEQEHGDCRYCRARVSNQKPWLKRVARIFPELPFTLVPLLDAEVRGVESLKKFGNLIWKPDSSLRTEKGSPSVRRTPYKFEGRREGKTEFPFGSQRFLIFGGKGGVGKTTAAAASALVLANSNPERKVLVFSTDPAHSLSDSFDENIGEYRDNLAGLPNLVGMEINPAKWFEDLKQRYRAWIDQLFESLAAHSKFEIKFERQAMREMVELTPPGIDEIAALGTISDLLEGGNYDTIVLDTAPTGHLIRFLELPDTALAWVRTFIKLLLKYQQIVHATRMAEELVALSRSMKRVLLLLTDDALCEFIGVAIPERMSLAETIDMAGSLKRLNVKFRRLLINNVIPLEAASECGFCRARTQAQAAVLSEFKRRFGKSIQIMVAPQQPFEVQGPTKLEEHFGFWQALPLARDSKTIKMSRSDSLRLKNGRRRTVKK